MTQSERDSFVKWLGGIPYEVAFWESYYGHARSLEQLYGWGDYGKKCELENFDIQSFLRRRGEERRGEERRGEERRGEERRAA